MEQVLATAHDLFAERGYAAVKMDEIAAAVGVTKPLLYTYFGNKERLYIDCMERAGDALTSTVAEAVAATSSPGDALRAGVRAFFGFLDSDRAAWAVLFDETLPASGEVAETSVSSAVPVLVTVMKPPPTGACGRVARA